MRRKPVASMIWPSKPPGPPPAWKSAATAENPPSILGAPAGKTAPYFFQWTIIPARRSSSRARNILIPSCWTRKRGKSTRSGCFAKRLKISIFRTPSSRLSAGRTSSLQDTVVPIIGRSDIIGRAWKTPLGLVFVDGSHAYESVLKDYQVWADHVRSGGYLVFHDIFPNPADGGQAPYLVYQQAVASGLFDAAPLFKSLGVLKKK